MPEEEESGIDELMRLSQQFTRQQEEHEEQERQREEQGRKVQGVLHGLQDLNISMTLEQLQSVAPPEIIKEVESLRTTGAKEDLRKVISSLADDLENKIGLIKTADAEKTELTDSMRTLNILMDLYFSLN
jgi:hypothetical protein